MDYFFSLETTKKLFLLGDYYNVALPALAFAPLESFLQILLKPKQGLPTPLVKRHTPLHPSSSLPTAL